MSLQKRQFNAYFYYDFINKFEIKITNESFTKNRIESSKNHYSHMNQLVKLLFFFKKRNLTHYDMNNSCFSFNFFIIIMFERKRI